MDSVELDEDEEPCELEWWEAGCMMDVDGVDETEPAGPPTADVDGLLKWLR